MKRRVRSRPETAVTDLVTASGSNNRRRAAAAAVLRGAVVAIWGASLAGCSLSFPIASIKPDDTPTGSIDRTAALLSPSLDREDLRRAEAAMAVTLDPQGNGARASWQNPQSGARGAFTAAGAPFADHDRVCRRFSGEVLPVGGGERRLSGSACRESDGSWVVRASQDAAAKA